MKVRARARRSTIRVQTLSPTSCARLMRGVGAARGVAELGYTEDDIATLVDGAIKQQRLLAVAPKEVGENDLRHIITASMTNW